MVDLNDIAVFVAVAQLESFSRAARALGMPVSTVSRKVTALEEQLGVTLIQRTTRKLSLTVQGRAYYDECSEPLKQLHDAERVLSEAQRKPEGLLRMSVPVTLGQPPFYDFLSGFLKKYPLIEVDLRVTNVFQDLVAENIDVAVRFGELRDSSLVAQRIGRTTHYLVAAPHYLDEHGAPLRPEDLLEHKCVLLGARNNEVEWHLVSGDRSIRLNVTGSVAVHDIQTLSAFVERGHGIGRLPPIFCAEALSSGKLIRVLPEWSAPDVFVHAIYPTRRFLPLRLQVFLQELKGWRSAAWQPLR
ncbi:MULTISPECIES: LysR family transcriptional regulator [unclassified Ensifer]|uniref:LysR family transcriptional regulator n=1 Tax=unclassified Ensifer TaxID=2633371 RepID=UPI0008132D41|nr:MULTISPECIES: LysR family transcriptional regulator [unclassified Ensifer]OCP11144.1 LysR family transcriptional regulator [Ensifer sp. LC14]OCP12684.1 LysR family transcriptional regulator [Ensifer sp. LC13]OCP13466.1 LysR family transcriptional regulator [Ensifer sp. LC11]OCP34127.1 LysR family transcriptional regulator [Ensifer sp. LC499]